MNIKHFLSIFLSAEPAPSRSARLSLAERTGDDWFLRAHSRYFDRNHLFTARRFLHERCVCAVRRRLCLTDIDGYVDLAPSTVVSARSKRTLPSNWWAIQILQLRHTIAPMSPSRR